MKSRLCLPNYKIIEQNWIMWKLLTYLLHQWKINICFLHLAKNWFNRSPTGWKYTTEFYQDHKIAWNIFSSLFYKRKHFHITEVITTHCTEKEINLTVHTMRLKYWVKEEKNKFCNLEPANFAHILHNGINYYFFCGFHSYFLLCLFFSFNWIFITDDIKCTKQIFLRPALRHFGSNMKSQTLFRIN